MSNVAYLDGDVIEFAGKAVARLAPDLWPSLRMRFKDLLETAEEPDAKPIPDPDLGNPAEVEEYRAAIFKAVRDRLAKLDNAAKLYSLAEINSVFAAIDEEMTE